MWTSGQTLGRFRLDREVGQGSHGVVWLATDTALSTPVAIKILHPWLTEDTLVRDRFKRELLLARRVAHPGICRLFDLHEDAAGAFFITMDYIEGETLLNILKNAGRMAPLRAVKIMRGVCAALSAAHAAGVTHRDLKPANIIIRSGDEPVILDFGTAIAQDVVRVTRPGTAVGSMRFIAPEIFTGTPPSAATDIYSLGVVAYVALAGRLPFNAASGALEMLQMIRGPTPTRLDALEPDVPPRLADLVARAMDRDPTARFLTADALSAGLLAVEAQLEAQLEAQTETRARIEPITKREMRWTPSTSSDGDAGADLSLITVDEDSRPHTLEPASESGPSAQTQASDLLAELVPDASSMEARDTAITTLPSELSGAVAPVNEPRRRSSEPTVRIARFDIARADTVRLHVDRRGPRLIATGLVIAVAVIGAAVWILGDAAPRIPKAAAVADANVIDAARAEAGLVFDVADLKDAPVEAVAPVPPVAPVPTIEAVQRGEGDSGSAARDRARADAEIKAVRTLLLRRGFLVGDLPEVDQLLRKARSAARAGRTGDVAPALLQARALVEGQAIDRAFVLAKLNRFNARFDRNQRPDITSRVTPIASEAAVSFSAGQFDLANQKLNRALPLLDPQ